MFGLGIVAQRTGGIGLAVHSRLAAKQEIGGEIDDSYSQMGSCPGEFASSKGVQCQSFLVVGFAVVRIGESCCVNNRLRLDRRTKPIDFTQIGEVKCQCFNSFQIYRMIQVGPVDPILAPETTCQVPSRESAYACD